MGRARQADTHDDYGEHDEDDNGSANAEAAEQTGEERITSARRLRNLDGRWVAVGGLLRLRLGLGAPKLLIGGLPALAVPPPKSVIGDGRPVG